MYKLLGTFQKQTINHDLYVTVPGKSDHLGNFFKIELLLQQERVGFELQNALHSDESKVERSYSR